jgi:hypothetical protein
VKDPIVADAPGPTGGRALHSHPLRLQLMHPDEALVEGCLNTLPLFWLGQRIQHQRQSVHAAISAEHVGSPEQGTIPAW